MPNPLLATYNRTPVRSFDVRPLVERGAPDKGRSAVDADWLTRELGKIEYALRQATNYTNTIVNVLDYGADPRGVKDSRPAINAAISAAAAMGGGIIYAPKGTYRLSIACHPDTTSVAAGIIMQSYCTLVGAGPSETTFLLEPLTNAVPTGCVANWQLQVISNATPYSLIPNKFQICYRDFTVDGNAINQTFVPPNQAHQLYLGKCRGAWIERVVSQNFYGTLPGPPGETMHFEAGGCADVHYTDCEAIGDADGGSTSSGFSANVSTFIEYTGCVARGMTVGMGFTHWTAAYMQYTNCHAYSNGYAGFNTEISEHITYTNCLAGGRGADTTSGVIGDQTPCPNQFGFKVLGSSYVNIIGCNASYNTTSMGYGVYISAYSGPVNSSYVLIDGSTIVANDVGIHIADVSQTNVFVTAGNILAGNTSSLFSGTGVSDTLVRYANAPIESWYAVNGTSGVRFNVTTGATTNGYRFLVNGNNTLTIVEQGSVEPVISLALPLRAEAATTTLTYADHTLTMDATGGARTVNLPSASSAIRRLYVIKKIDASGNAVTVDANGGDLIDGAGTYALPAQWDAVTLQSDGTNWHVLSTV